jgi:integrase
MPTLRLIKSIIDKIPLTDEGQCLYRDSDLTGFGLCVGTRRKTYFVEGRLNNRRVRQAYGQYPLMTVEQARSEAMGRLASLMQGINPEAANRAKKARDMTLGEAFAAYFEAKPNLAAPTMDNYQRSRDLYLKDWLKFSLREITRDLVLAKHRQIGKDHGGITGNNAMRHFRAVYNFVGSLHDEYPPCPTVVLTRTRSWVPQRRRRTLVAAHQLPAWWRVVMAEEPHARDFLLVALFTGMRRNEIAKLRWEHVDLVGKTLNIPRTKNGDPLELPLSDFLCGVIARRRELVGQCEYVFPGPGATKHIIETKRFLSRVVWNSGVKFTLHDLRRSFITIAESLDISTYGLKRLLNHRADNDVTAGYIVIGAERLRGPVERIAAQILELANAQEKAPLGI